MLVFTGVLINISPLKDSLKTVSFSCKRFGKYHSDSHSPCSARPPHPQIAKCSLNTKPWDVGSVACPLPPPKIFSRWFQPIWKILVKLDDSPSRGENKKSLKPPPRLTCHVKGGSFQKEMNHLPTIIFQGIPASFRGSVVTLSLVGDFTDPKTYPPWNWIVSLQFRTWKVWMLSFLGQFLAIFFSSDLLVSGSVGPKF